jgi:hypothetical protein
LKTVVRANRARLTGRIVTASPFYQLDEAQPGTQVASVTARLKLGRPFVVGPNTWYIVRRASGQRSSADGERTRAAEPNRRVLGVAALLLTGALGVQLSRSDRAPRRGSPAI